MRKFAVRAVALLFALISTTVLAQSYPSKPVKIIIGYGPAGVTDVILRLAAEDLGKRLGGTFVVENRVGAGGLLAAQAVKNSAADGYTLFGGAATPFHPVFAKDNFMDAAKDLQPVSTIAIGDNFLIVRSDLGVNNFREFVAKARSTRLKHASLASTQQALMAAFAKGAGFDFDNIPYKATDQTITALLSGDCDFALTSVAGWTSHIKSGKLKLLATLAPNRSPIDPTVPTAKELGANVEFQFSIDIWAPMGTPRDVLNKLSAAISETVKSPAVAEKVAVISMIPQGSTPDGLLRLFQAQMKTYGDAANLIGLAPQ